MSEDEIKAGGNPFDNVICATRSGEQAVAAASTGGGFLDGIKEAMNNWERKFTSGR
jgi:hypothetical protein